MMSEIHGEIRDGSGWIVINRPEKRNAVTLEMWDEMRRVLAHFIKKNVRSIVITGISGHFAAGADLTEFAVTKASPEEARRSFLAVDNVCRAIYEAPMPIIAAIEGYAIGAGLELAVACDIRLATTTVKIGITASKLGITIGYRHIRRLVSVIGPAHAIDLLTSARLLSANDAYRMGLVTEVAEDGEALGALVDRWVDRYARRAPLSLAWAKEAVHQVVEDPGMHEIQDDAGQSIRCFETHDFREAIRAFRERRVPEFTGQ